MMSQGAQQQQQPAAEGPEPTLPDPQSLPAITPAALAAATGADGGAIWLAIRGYVFDVTAGRAMYGTPGKGYAVFVGRDASRALARSSLKPEECVPDFEGLTAEELATLDKWLAFFTRKYPVVGFLKAA